MASLRARRIEQEWRLLSELALDNPALLKDLSRSDVAAGSELRITLAGAEAPADLSGGAARLSRHHVRLRFPRFYPGTPIEAYLDEPVFHPNVDPRNGFVCLWTKTHIGDTAVEAVRRLRLILAWRSYNLDADHIMQPAAAERARAGGVPGLAFTELRGLPARRGEGTGRPRRTRLF